MNWYVFEALYEKVCHENTPITWNSKPPDISASLIEGGGCSSDTVLTSLVIHTEARLKVREK